MATITPTLTLTSNASSATTPGPLSFALSLSATDSLTVNGVVTSNIVTCTTNHADNKILDASALGASYVYIKNISDTTIYLCIGDAGTTTNNAMTIAAGEFAFFPWAGTIDYYLESASGSKKAEYFIFAQS
jgi:hypothetical protein|tara:strand:+ start:294 stop:686 length:393 start_codon:yes stop_codon:yes gene_type:complete